MHQDAESAPPSTSTNRPAGDGTTRQRQLLARLVSRAYCAVDEPLRLRMLSCLLRPLGTLSVAAVAAGAFGQVLYRRSGFDVMANFSREQVLELARFAHEVDPDALQQVAELLADHAAGAAAFSSAALILLYRRLRRRAD